MAVLVPRNKVESLCIALIHNNDFQRNNYVLPKIFEIKDSFSKKFDVKIIFISNQPEIRPHTSSQAIYRKLQYLKLDREWCKYRNLRPKSLAISLPLLMWDVFNSYTFRRQSGLLWNKKSYIETVVTDKHIRSWNAFSETNCEYLICFEDDIVFKDNSIQKLENILEFVKNQKDRLIYIDLAGGCNLEDLKISNLEIRHDDYFRYYTKPVTNTACAYLINKPLINIFLDNILRKPHLRLIGIDWMINKLFININPDRNTFFCVHSDPSIFLHGTKSGEYKSWNSD
ncbi:MAG TPA: hypothetical protein PLN56_07340 [Methanoregulaceae archaeon]|nr:MAG: hypothetical protein IPI71_04150 [Methanolinea sp.]HON82097.1 hypothetical protein [Methanoregulaceae archaeon]HPD10795.1 hypothetical protein [Methanoregulaceae archaeon]HRT15983.1 hypothetical protein [Methanoregulaceae archaeon]HRU31448.1 hypothetical protein [Methanoregulaceae archaeon]